VLGALAGLLFVLGATCLAAEDAGGMPPKGSSEEVYRRKIIQLQRDRSNILAQTRRLQTRIAEWRAAMQGMEKTDEEKARLASEVKKLSGRVDLQMEEIEVAKKEIDEAMERVEELLLRQNELEKEKAGVEEQYSKSRLGKNLRQLKVEKDKLYRERKQLAADLAKARKNLVAIERKSRDEKRGLVRQVEKLQLETDAKVKKYEERLQKIQKAYAEAQKEKEAMDRRVENLPEKFARLARQKQKLVEDTANMHYNLGVFYSKKKNYKRAMAEFKEAVELKPDHSLATYNMAHIYAAYFKEKDKAIRYFKRYLNISPGASDRSEVMKYISTWETWAGEKEVQ
jgi:tetratricopeptide (TPR) repeat protein